MKELWTSGSFVITSSSTLSRADRDLHGHGCCCTGSSHGRKKGHGQELGLLADRRKSPHSPGWAVPMVPGNARPAAPLLRLGTGAATAEVGSVLYATRDWDEPKNGLDVMNMHAWPAARQRWWRDCLCIMRYRSWLACRRISHMEKQHAAEVINGHGVIIKEEGKRGDAYQRTTTNGQRGGHAGGDNGKGRREKI